MQTLTCPHCSWFVEGKTRSAATIKMEAHLAGCPKRPKSRINPAKNGNSHQSKHHSMSVECPRKPDQRVRGGLSPNDAKVVAETLRNLVVASKAIQNVMQSEGRKWQLVTDSHPNVAVVQKIEHFLQEAIEIGEDVLVNYMGEKPVVRLFTALPKYQGYEEGVG